MANEYIVNGVDWQPTFERLAAELEAAANAPAVVPVEEPPAPQTWAEAIERMCVQLSS